MSLIATLAALSSAGSALASVLSPKVQRTERALTEWLASEGQKDLLLPDELGRCVQNLPEPGAAMAPGQEPALRLLILTGDAPALRAAGFEVRTVAGEVTTATVPLSRLRELETLSGVSYVQLPMPLKPFLDVSRVDVRADEVHGGTPPNYTGNTGDGVVVGIIDTGIDLDHEDFHTAGGASRISYLWDQVSGGNPPPGFNYGTEWTAGNIASSTEKDFDGHGTHVSGIAAGNGKGTGRGRPQYQYVGIAPGAEIFFCKALFFEDALIDACQWIKNRAGSKPFVINMSLGNQVGPHDGTSPLDLAMRSFSGPGKILVSAAGNESGTGIHAEFQAPPSGSGEVDVRFTVSSYTPSLPQHTDALFMEGWFPSSSNIRIRLITPNGTTVGPIDHNQSTDVDTNNGTVQMDYSTYPANGDKFIDIVIWDRNGVNPSPGTWTVRAENLNAAPNEADFWITSVALGFGWTRVLWENFSENAELVASPASSDSVLAVGTYVTKTTWIDVNGNYRTYWPAPTLQVIAPFSSPGPRRDGEQKPDLSAPGMGIASTKGSDAQSPYFSGSGWTVRDGVHVVSQGTSMSAPHVAGSAALVLQNNPSLAFREMRDLLVATARHDAFTGPGWSPEYGHGKIDAWAALEASGVNNPPVALCKDGVIVATDSTSCAMMVDPSEVDDGSFDPDGDPITMTLEPPGPYPLGSTPVALIVIDDLGAVDMCTATVTVVDDTPPELTVELNREMLWPPNHKLADIRATVTATDNCDPNPSFVLTSVTSNEPDDGLGDGDMPDDIQGAETGTPDVEFQVRSERSGLGGGRMYTIVYTATDASGNSTETSVRVTVPHDRSGMALAGSGFTSDGTGLDPGADVFQLIVRALRSRDIDPARSFAGSLSGVLAPTDHDWINRDGHEELVLEFEVRPAEDLRRPRVDGDAPQDLALRYETYGGEAFLVEDIFHLGGEVVGVDEGSKGSGPSYRLLGARPNPFRASTRIEYELGESGTVRLAVFSLTGRLVRMLVGGESKDAGRHDVLWDGTDESGRRVAPGVYFYRLSAKGKAEVRRVVLLD